MERGPHFQDKTNLRVRCRRRVRLLLTAMGAFLVKRIPATIPVLVIVAVIVFTLIRLVPGDPAAVIAGNMATNGDIARIRTELGLDRGFFTQFLLWAKGLVSGDLGQSFFFKKEVTALIAERLEPTPRSPSSPSC